MHPVDIAALLLLGLLTPLAAAGVLGTMLVALAGWLSLDHVVGYPIAGRV